MSDYKTDTTNNKRNTNAKFPYLVLALALVITIGISYNFHQNALNKDQIRFNNEVNQTLFAIENKINLYVALLKSGRSFIESSTAIDGKVFAEYVGSLELEKNYTGLQAIGYGENNSHTETASLLVQTETPAHSVKPENAGNKKTPFPFVVNTQPKNKFLSERNTFDITREENLIEAFKRAGETGKLVLSSKTKFRGDNPTNETNGFFLVLPVNNQNKSSISAEDDGGKPAGYIFCAVDANDFLIETRKSIASDIVAVKIYETENKTGNLLAPDGFTNAGYFNDEKNNFSTQREMVFGGKKWIVEFNSLPAFAEESSVKWTLLVILTGVFFSFLLFSIIYTEVSARIYLQETAGKLMELQEQKQILLEKEKAARKSAESANRTKDEFIAVVSHELKTPLNAISGWTNILRTENLPEDKKKLALKKIEKNLHLQAELVEEILDYSQIISGTANLNKEKIQFSEIFEKTFLDFEPKAREKNIEFIKDNQANGHSILGDNEKIKLVIDNLFSNAIKFTHPGGRIKALVVEDEGLLQMIVKDSGEGISAEFLPFIFEKFRQADASITRSSGGLGLGLTISNHIVTLHDGVIEVNSEGKGKGSVFTVKLPLLIHDA